MYNVYVTAYSICNKKYKKIMKSCKVQIYVYTFSLKSYNKSEKADDKSGH